MSAPNILFDILHSRVQAIADALDSADTPVAVQAITSLQEIAARSAAEYSAEYEASVDQVLAVLSRLQSSHAMKVRAQALLDCAIYYHHIGKNYKGIDAGEAGLVLAESLGEQALTRRLCNVLGTHYMHTANYMQGMLRLDRGLQLARQLHDPLAEAAVVANIIGLFTDAGLYKDALHVCRQFPALALDTTHGVILNFQSAINGLFSALRLNEYSLCEHYIQIGNSLLPFDVIEAESCAMFVYYQALYYMAKEQPERLRMLAEDLRTPEVAAANPRLQVLHNLARSVCEFGQGQTDIAVTRLISLRTQTRGQRYHDDVLQALIMLHEKLHNHFEALGYAKELLEYMASVKKANYHRQLRAVGVHIALENHEHDELERIEQDASVMRVAAYRNRTEGIEYTTAESWAITAELIDDDTGEHCYRVGLLARLLAQAAGCDAAYCARIEQAARLHDLGKIGVSHTILLKPGKLSPNELASMRQHTLIGHDLLSSSGDATLRMAASIARHHHEWWNGHGYPDKLYSERIPLEARLCALADVFDALTHERRYKRAWSREEALAEIHFLAGRQFDPSLTKLLPKVLRAYDSALAARTATVVQQAKQAHSERGFMVVKELLLAKLANAAPPAA
jgi:putative two-component system response regulator